MTCFEYPQLDERVYRTRLENGLQVMVIPRKDFTRKCAYFATDFGAIHTEFEFEGKHYTVPGGVAHFLEHKMFDMPDGTDVSGEFAALGANVNAFTSYDMTAYYFSTTDHFEKCLEKLLSFVSTPWFTEESIQKELGIIDQEIGMTEDSPDNRVYEQLLRNAYTVHPIRVPILGSRESIRQITPEILNLCHRAFYTPENMVLCVVGDVEAEAVAETARRVLGTEHKPRGTKVRHWNEPPEVPVPLENLRMDVAMPMFQLLFKCGESLKGPEGFHQEMVADLAAEWLFGESSELYLRLYEEGLIDSSFGGGFETIDGCAMLTLGGDSEDAEAVRDAIFAQAERLAQRGMEEGDFRRLLRCSIGSRIKGLDSFDSTCFRLCAYHMFCFDYFKFPEVVRQVTPEEITRFLRETVLPQRVGMCVIYPQQQEENYES